MTEYKITYQDTHYRPQGFDAPEYHDYLPIAHLGQRVTALVTSGYIVTRIEKADIKDFT